MRGNHRLVSLAAAAFAAVLCGTGTASAQTVIDAWNTIKAPPPPTLQSVTVDPRTTALLVLDFVTQTCNSKPRCLASLPKVAALLKAARAAKALVVYSVVVANKGTEAVLPAVKPLGTEPVVKGGPDKFLGTDLAEVLKSHGITTVIPVGTAAEGAVMYTASHAAFLGYKVVLPVDGMSSNTLYAEQYVAWNMVNAPRLAMQVTETTTDRVSWK
jgi:nicotinamidase-related amidase